MIKPIRTSTDLQLGKVRLSDLIRSNQGGMFTDEIEVLSTLVEQYERDNSTIVAPSPIAAIKFRMEQRGMTPRQLEPFIGSRARVSEVLSGKRQLTLDMIRSLHEGLGIPYESLITRGSAATPPRATSGAALEHLNTLGCDLSIEEVQSFVHAAYAARPQRVLHRKTRTQRAASKMDQSALLLWQAAVLNKGKGRSNRATFNRASFGPDALRKLARLSRQPDGPRRVVDALADYGISTVVLPPLPGTFLDGAAMLDTTSNPVIGLTLRHDRTDNFWFTLLHEAAHISLHYDELVDAGAAFVDDMEIGSDDIFEREADMLAQESLIPSSLLSQIQWGERTTQDDVIALSVRSRVHVSIVAGRWQRDHQNYKRFSRLIERGTIRSQLGSA